MQNMDQATDVVGLSESEKREVSQSLSAGKKAIEEMFEQALKEVQARHQEAVASIISKRPASAQGSANGDTKDDDDDMGRPEGQNDGLEPEDIDLLRKRAAAGDAETNELLEKVQSAANKARVDHPST